MKLQAEVGDENLEIEIKRDGRRVVANVDGREYELDVSEPAPDTYLFKHGSRVFEALTSGAGGKDNVNVIVGNRSFDVKIIDPKRLRSSSTDSGAADGVAEIRSAMPGKIVRTLVNTGDSVEKGQGIIVVEAMKMQNELKSPKEGLVKEIRVEVGCTVSAGEVLVTVE